MEQTSIIQVASIPNRIVESKNVFSNFKGIEGEIYTIPEMEKQLIIKALKQYGTSITGKEKAAKALSLGIATLYRKIKKYKIMDELF
jgi:transcriptional regulator with PAS, ATPase and Fis domain